MPKDDKSNDELVREFLKHWNKQKYEEYHGEDGTKIGRYSASDTWKCLYYLYEKYTDPNRGYREINDVKKLTDLYFGEVIEELVEKALVHRYGNAIENDIEIELDCGNFKIIGETDPVRFNEDGEVEALYEVKSTKTLKYVEEKPSTHHLWQVHPYMRGVSADSCTIIYVQRYPLYEISHRVEFDDELFDREVERLGRLHGCLVEKEPPEPEYPSGVEWHCQFCQFRDKCPKFAG